MACSTGLVMHIANDLDLARRRELEKSIEHHPGVTSAYFNERRPHLMVVEYDPQLVSYYQIMREVGSRNLQAERVG